MVSVKSNAGNIRRTNDEYLTPKPLCNAVLNKFPLTTTAKFLDTGAGTGNWGLSIRGRYKDAVIDGVELREMSKPDCYTDWYNIDYLSFFPTSKYDVIIGNPPFRLAEEFIHKSLSLLSDTGILVYVLRLNFLSSISRYHTLWTINPPTYVEVLSRRPSWYFEDSGSKLTYPDDFAIYYWNKENKTKKTNLEFLMWDY